MIYRIQYILDFMLLLFTVPGTVKHEKIPGRQQDAKGILMITGNAPLSKEDKNWRLEYALCKECICR